jgi:hypothetical protein
MTILEGVEGRGSDFFKTSSQHLCAVNANTHLRTRHFISGLLTDSHEKPHKYEIFTYLFTDSVVLKIMFNFTHKLLRLIRSIQGPTRCTFLCIIYSSLFLALHVSGAFFTHPQEHNCRVQP